MCYQVVERYNVCRCLYYKHAIDPCAAHGQRGHVVQEKTVLVGYACGAHTSRQDAFAISQDIVNAFEDSDDVSDDEGSIFSNVIAVSRATSFIAVDGSDTIDEILHVLLNDPLLRWDNLRYQTAEDTKYKDVRFFLRAYELSLRAAADSNIERHACTFLQSRLRYLSSRICDHFYLEDRQELAMDDLGSKKDIEELEVAAVDQPDPTLMPSFSLVRSFLFETVAFQALKGNLRDFARSKRDHLEEIIAIVVENIHPPTKRFAKLPNAKRWPWDKFPEALNVLVATFVRRLAEEAIECKLSASDRIGTRELAGSSGIAQIHTRLIKLWDGGVPPWHFYPLVPGEGSELGYSHLEGGHEEEADPDVEVFRNFVCSSRALLYLASACLESSQGPRVSMSSAVQENCSITEGTVEQTRISFVCPCGSTITEIYNGSVQSHLMRQKLKQLRKLSVQQTFQRTASVSPGRRTFKTSVRRFLDAFSWSWTSPCTQLPLHQQRHKDDSGTDLGASCKSPANGIQHHCHFIHFCIPSTYYATHMSPLQACSIRSDADFFIALRAAYYKKTGRYRRILSFKKPTALRFVKFRLYHRLLVDIHETDTIPPESEKDEYDYSPMPAETIPPIGSKLLMHFFLHPDHAAMQPTLLANIPKRKKEKLEPCPVAGSSVGWGLDVTMGVDQFKLFGVVMLGALASILFGVIWAVAREDIQGSFAVAGFMLALVVTVTGTLNALEI